MIRRPPRSTLFPTRRSSDLRPRIVDAPVDLLHEEADRIRNARDRPTAVLQHQQRVGEIAGGDGHVLRSEEHTSELQSQSNIVCRLLLEKKKKKKKTHHNTKT